MSYFSLPQRILIGDVFVFLSKQAEYGRSMNNSWTHDKAHSGRTINLGSPGYSPRPRSFNGRQWVFLIRLICYPSDLDFASEASLLDGPRGGP